MDREIRSILRHILSTGDLPLDNQEQIHALIQVCQERIAYLNQGRGYYLIPALDPDREDEWFVIDPSSHRPSNRHGGGPFGYEGAISVAQWLNTRLAIRQGPLSDTPGMSGVYHRVGCTRVGGTLTHYPDVGPRCEYCAVGPS